MEQNLYRKYRPKTFEDVIGQEVAIKTLENSIKNKSVSHAYLFSGIRGTGKTSIAKIFARAVNCESSDTSLCNKCESCISSSASEVPDIIEIDAASNNGVDEIREIIDNVKFVPINLKYKVYIIDEVHMLTKGAFNALLKTLEEPPKHVIFILATTDPNKIPLTILSRCQRFELKRVNKNLISNLIKNILIKEDIKFEETAIDSISRLSEGSVRDALSLCSKVLGLNNTLLEEDTKQALHLSNIEDIESLINSILKNDSNGINTCLSNILENGTSESFLMSDLMSNIKDHYLQKDGINQEHCLKILKTLTEIDNRLRYSSNPQLLIEVNLMLLSSELNSKDNSQEEFIKNDIEEIEIKQEPNFEVEPRVEEQEKPKTEETQLEQSKDTRQAEDLNNKKVEKKQTDEREDLFTLLSTAKKEKKQQQTQNIQVICNDLFQQNKVGLLTFFQNCQVCAANDNDVLLSIASHYYNDYMQKIEEIRSILNVNNLLLITDEFWTENRQRYADMISKEKDNSLIEEAAQVFGQENINIRG